MADTKISALTAVTTVAGTNELAINEAGTSKKISMTQFSEFMRTLEIGHFLIKRLTADHVVSGAGANVATEVTGLSVTLAAGTYLFEYFLLDQVTITAGVGTGFGINYTGTASRLAFSRRYAAGGTGTVSSTQFNILNTLTGNMMCGFAATAEQTTTPNTLSGAHTAVDVDCLTVIEGTIVVTDGGDLELWASAESAGSTITVEQESCVRITRMA